MVSICSACVASVPIEATRMITRYPLAGYLFHVSPLMQLDRPLVKEVEE